MPARINWPAGESKVAVITNIVFDLDEENETWRTSIQAEEWAAAPGVWRGAPVARFTSTNPSGHEAAVDGTTSTPGGWASGYIERVEWWWGDNNKDPRVDAADTVVTGSPASLINSHTYASAGQRAVSMRVWSDGIASYFASRIVTVA